MFWLAGFTPEAGAMLCCPCLYALRATGTALRAALRVVRRK